MGGQLRTDGRSALTLRSVGGVGGLDRQYLAEIGSNM